MVVGGKLGANAKTRGKNVRLKADVFYKRVGQVCVERGIFRLSRAYDKGMKKSIFAMVLAVAMGFITAVALCVRALNVPQAVFSDADSKMKIVIDAGHGGIDGGVMGKTTGIKESDLNLEITMRLKEVLIEMGFEVALTRKTEAGLYDTAAKGFKKRDMQKRKEIIQEEDPSLVISVHQNLFPSKSSRGAQVFYRKNSENGEKFAKALQAQLNELYGEEGVKARNAATGNYFMLECTENPSVIVECGFLSSPADEALLVSPAWQRKLAERIAAGVVAYLAGELS